MRTTILRIGSLLAVLALVRGYETSVPHLLTDPTW